VDLLRQSFEHLTDGAIKKIEKALNHYEETHRSDYHKKQFMAAREFHLTLASFAQAPITYTTLHRLFDLIYLKYQVDTLFSRGSEQAMTTHRKIVERIKAGDCEGACACLTEDIDNVSRRVVDNMMKNIEEKENFQI